MQIDEEIWWCYSALCIKGETYCDTSITVMRSPSWELIDKLNCIPVLHLEKYNTTVTTVFYAALRVLDSVF